MTKNPFAKLQPSLKKTFQLILVFYFFAHFLLPVFLYKIFGFEPLYLPEFNFDICNDAYHEMMLISAACFLITMVGVNFLPDTKGVEARKIRFPYLFFYINICFDVFFFFYNGGYNGISSGNLKLKALAYVQYFSNSKLSFILTDALAGGGSFFKAFIYVIAMTLMGSRAAIFIIYFSLAFIFVYSNWKSAYKKYFLILIFLTPFSFFAFNAATHLRQHGIPLPELGQTDDGSGISRPGEQKSVFKGDASTSSRIKIGRLSLWETATIPICNPLLKNDAINLFDSKFGLFHQVGLAINVFSPLKIIPRDAWPNQYYQAIFLNYPIEGVQNNYYSVNMGLQTYLRLVTGNPYAAVLLFVVISLAYYYLAICIFRYYQLGGMVFLVFFYELLIFFDLTYYLSFLLKGFLTLALLEAILFVQRKVKDYALSQ